MASTSPQLDEGFLKRVGGVSLLITALGALLGSYYLGWRWGAGFASAGVWSVLNFKALEHLIRLAVRPDGRDRGAIAAALVIKIPVLYGLGILIAWKGGFPAGSLLLGFGVPLGVLVLKTVGQVLAPRVALPQRGVDENENGRVDPSRRR
jgi:hypothetical protein